MYFLVQGELSYAITDEESESKKAACHRVSSRVSDVPFGEPDAISSGKESFEWFSEAALWMQWEHRGTMTAEIHSELFAVEAKRFQEMMSQEPRCAGLCGAYARAFVDLAKLEKRLTDISIVDESVLQNIVSNALGEDIHEDKSELAVPVAFGEKAISTPPGVVKAHEDAATPSKQRSGKQDDGEKAAAELPVSLPVTLSEPDKTEAGS
jgi:hypothetical protein